MANKIIERLKADPSPKTSIFRALNAITFSFQYDDESGGAFGVDQGGFLITRDELKDLTEALNILFDYYGDEAIKEHNDKKQADFDAPYHPSQEPEDKPIRAKSKGWVYVLKGQNDLYKIGLTTRQPDKRLAEFAPKLPFKTELILTIQSDNVYALEAELHEYYASQRVNGEWFKLSQDNIAWMLRSGGRQE